MVFKEIVEEEKEVAEDKLEVKRAANQNVEDPTFNDM